MDRETPWDQGAVASFPWRGLIGKKATRLSYFQNEMPNLSASGSKLTLALMSLAVTGVTVLSRERAKALLTRLRLPIVFTSFKTCENRLFGYSISIPRKSNWPSEV